MEQPISCLTKNPRKRGLLEVKLKKIPQGHRCTTLKSCAIDTRCLENQLRFMLEPCPSMVRVFQGTNGTY